jgi:MFS family permease
MANKYLSEVIAGLAGSIFVSLVGYDFVLGFIVSIIVFGIVGAATEWMTSSKLKDINESRKLSMLAGMIAGLVGGIFALIVFISLLYPGDSVIIPLILVVWIMLIVIGAVMSPVGATLMRRSMNPEDFKWPILNTSAMSGGHVIYEKETIKEVVKIPCSYCGTLVENTATKCPSCGAPFKR